jgi:hypothetical protein
MSIINEDLVSKSIIEDNKNADNNEIIEILKESQVLLHS